MNNFKIFHNTVFNSIFSIIKLKIIFSFQKILKNF